MYSYKIDIPQNDDLFRENIVNDYELIKIMYDSSMLHIHNENLEEQILEFEILLRKDYEIEDSLASLVSEFGFNELMITKNTIALPYSIKYECDYYSDMLISIQITMNAFWMKRRLGEFERFKAENNEKSYSKESLFFTMTENFKEFIPHPESKTVLNWLQELRERMLMIKDSNLNDLLYSRRSLSTSTYETKNGVFEEDYNSFSNSTSLMQKRAERLLETSKNKPKKNLSNMKKEEETQQKDNIEYEQFLNDGGKSGQIITDRGSTFQAHVIKITSYSQVNKYLKQLKTNNKIEKATHNILAYRLLSSSSSSSGKDNHINNSTDKKGLTEGFDDDGEDGAGLRLLGMLGKMKILNVMVVVSRWFGGTLLGNDRFKHINDAAKILISNNKNDFEYAS
jgi:hypothetical protein